jgi:hypothetical protein
MFQSNPEPPQRNTLLLSVAKTALLADLDAQIQTLQSKRQNIQDADDGLWADYLDKEAYAITGLQSLIASGIVNAISAYNSGRRRLENVDITLKRQPTSSGIRCNTITCKQRGEDIKKALIQLATFSPETLGNLGMASLIANTGKSTLNIGINATRSTYNMGANAFNSTRRATSQGLMSAANYIAPSRPGDRVGGKTRRRR